VDLKKTQGLGRLFLEGFLSLSLEGCQLDRARIKGNERPGGGVVIWLKAIERFGPGVAKLGWVSPEPFLSLRLREKRRVIRGPPPLR